MKRFIAISLVLLLSADCLFKLGVLTYYQINREYIAEVLCINKEKPMTVCHGQCFLNEKMALADVPEEGTLPVQKLSLEIPAFLPSTPDFAFEAPFTEIMLNGFIHHAYRFNNAVEIFRPPKPIL